MVRKKRVINGEDAEIEEFPYLVQLHWWDPEYSGYKQICGGTIIGPKFVLSAAHCFLFDDDTELPIREILIFYGTSYREQPIESDKILLVSNYWIHERYDPVTAQNDISLIKV